MKFLKSPIPNDLPATEKSRFCKAAAILKRSYD